MQTNIGRPPSASLSFPHSRPLAAVHDLRRLPFVRPSAALLDKRLSLLFLPSSATLHLVVVVSWLCFRVGPTHMPPSLPSLFLLPRAPDGAVDNAIIQRHLFPPLSSLPSVFYTPTPASAVYACTSLAVPHAQRTLQTRTYPLPLLPPPTPSQSHLPQLHLVVVVVASWLCFCAGPTHVPPSPPSSSFFLKHPTAPYTALPLGAISLLSLTFSLFLSAFCFSTRRCHCAHTGATLHHPVRPVAVQFAPAPHIRPATSSSLRPVMPLSRRLPFSLSLHPLPWRHAYGRYHPHSSPYPAVVAISPLS